MSVRKRILHPFARRFFAGTTLEDALVRAGALNRAGMGATLDFLGEDVRDMREVEGAAREYSRAIEAVAMRGLDASVALKLTHVGLDMGREAALDNALALAETAKDLGVFIWVDMEGSEHTDDTIGIYRRLLAEYPGGVGLALQAYLKRTWADLPIALSGARIRLVKGAYSEPPEVALQGMSEIRAQFKDMMAYLIKNSGDFAIGSHDRELVKAALGMSIGRAVRPEFQMLMGMRDDLKRSLVGKGLRVVEYVPYGPDWYGYGLRRLKEKRRNILYFAQGLFGR